MPDLATGTTAAPFVAAGGSLLSGISSLFGGGGGNSEAALDAANIQANAIRTATALQSRMYDETKGNLAPWLETGKASLGQYAGLLNVPGYTAVDPTATLRATPGYANWLVPQTIKAIDQSASSRGTVFSGGHELGVMNAALGMADQTYKNYLENLYKLVGSGQNAAAQQGAFSQLAANQMGNLTVQGGTAQARGILGAQNARTSAYNTGVNQLMGGLSLGAGALRNYLDPYGYGGYGGYDGGYNPYISGGYDEWGRISPVQDIG